jgi:hypothetical protein
LATAFQQLCSDFEMVAKSAPVVRPIARWHLVTALSTVGANAPQARSSVSSIAWSATQRTHPATSAQSLIV